MSDGTELFHADHSNLVGAGSGAAPTISTLNTAIAAMRNQATPDGTRKLNNRPHFFVAPTVLEATGEALFKSLGSGKTGNPYGDEYFTRIYDSRLDASSTTSWYLLGPKNKTVKLLFLGSGEPEISSQLNWHNDSIDFRVRIDAAAGPVSHRTFYKNAGA